MTTPRSRGLLSFRRSVARIAKDRAAADDGWVHGGKYVPATASAGRPPQRPSSTPDAANGAAGSHGPASGRGGTPRQQQPSPYAMLSPAPLDTPLPQESMGAPSTGPPSNRGGGASTALAGAVAPSNPTPPTVQLQRLLEPTPAHARTPQSMTNDTIATPDHAGGQQAVLAPTTPMGHFLRRSGVPPAASRAIGDAATQLYDRLFSLLVAAWNAAAGGWTTLVAVHFPRDLIPDVVETLGELVVDVLRMVWRVAKVLAPFLLWAAQTLLALALTSGGTVVWGMIFLFKGSREEANNSGAGEVQSSALKSLKESVRNSPFFRRGGRTLPFTGFTDGMAPHSGNSAGSRAVQSAAAAPTSTTVHAPSSTRSTPPVSAMRHVRPTPRATTNAAGGQKTPATARRVLFSETERGEVATEHFHFDKHLPASARKVVDPRGTDPTGPGGGMPRRHSVPQASGAAQTNGAAQRNDMSRKVPAASPAVASGTASPSSTPENTILRPSKYYDSPADSSEKIPQKKTAEPFQPKPASTMATQPHSASASKTAAKKEEDVRNEEERQKQQYIERYGLLPTITPLSKRYGRMKRQQQQQQGKQPLAIGNGPAASASKNDPTAGANRNIGANPKRKRRGDLLGAASRLGRTRRARLGAAPSALPSVLLRRATPHKRRRDDAGLSAADAWVWRAMNKDPDHGKENRANDGASEATAAKKGKFASSSSGSSDVVGTPPKNYPTPTTLPSVMTPPKTPGPSKFSTLGSATPAPKKWSGTDAASTATPGKPTLPFSFGDDSAGGDASKDAGGGAAFSFGAKTNDGASTAATSSSTGGAGFSFGTTAPAAASEKNDAPAASSTPGFSFGAAATAASTEKKDATAAPASGAAGFSFNASTTAASAPAAVEKATPAPASGGAGFSFNASATATSAPATSDKKEAASTPAFSFGSNASTTTASTGAEPSSAAPAPFSFGSTASTDTSKAPAPAAAAATPGFAFGSSQPAPTPAATTPAVSFGQPTPAPPASASSGAMFSFETGASGAPAAATPATASAPTTAPFSFGSSSQPTPAAQPKEAAPAGAAFSFGTQPAPAAGATQPSTFAFGAGATAAPPAPNFAGLGATPASGGFSLGGSGASGGGASARRRAAKASGRRR